MSRRCRRRARGSSCGTDASCRRPAEHELWRGRADRRPDIDQIERRIIAGDHPRADVEALLERHAAPALVAGLPGTRDQTAAPQLGPGHRVVRDHNARLRPAARRATASRDDLAVGDDGPGALRRRVDPVVEDLRLPDHLAGHRVERVDVVVDRGVDDQPAVDGDVAVVGGERPEQVVADIVRDVAAMLPDEIAGHRVEGLDDVVRVRHVQRAVVGQRGARLKAVGEPPRPHHAQLAHVADADLVQWAVAPAIRRPAPGQPVAVSRLLEHGVGDRRKSSPDCARTHVASDASARTATAPSTIHRVMRSEKCIVELLGRVRSARFAVAPAGTRVPGRSGATQRFTATIGDGAIGPALRYP